MRDGQKAIKTDTPVVFSLSAQLFHSKLTGKIVLLKLSAMTFPLLNQTTGEHLFAFHMSVQECEIGLSCAKHSGLGMFTRQQLAALLCLKIWEKCLQHSSGGRARAGSSLQYWVISVPIQVVGIFPTQAGCASTKCFWQVRSAKLTLSVGNSQLAADFLPFSPTQTTAKPLTRTRFFLLKYLLTYRQ